MQMTFERCLNVNGDAKIDYGKEVLKLMQRFEDGKQN